MGTQIEQVKLLESIRNLTGLLTPANQKALLEGLSAEVASRDPGQVTAAGKTKALEVLPVGPLTMNEQVKSLVTQAGGVFVGKEELVKLGKIGADAEIPAMPEWISRSLLESEHPLRGDTIASHVIIGFDIESRQWLVIDRGNGGNGDIVPGSLGQNGRGLIGSEQDKLTCHINVKGAGLSSPTDSYPVERVLDSAIVLHMMDKKPIESLPFRGIWGRTADTKRGALGWRVLLGGSDEGSANVYDRCHGDGARVNVGLLACWNQK